MMQYFIFGFRRYQGIQDNSRMRMKNIGNNLDHARIDAKLKQLADVDDNVSCCELIFVTH